MLLLQCFEWKQQFIDFNLVACDFLKFDCCKMLNNYANFSFNIFSLRTTAASAKTLENWSFVFYNSLYWSISLNEWLPCRQDVERTKIMDLNFDRNYFAKWDKKKRYLDARPTKKQTFGKIRKKSIVADSFCINTWRNSPNSMLFTTFAKLKTDFDREIIT